tara:strand:- start:1379 stop:2167 length:789 start_codon:yes stop_codon:yes gene_type:complete
MDFFYFSKKLWFYFNPVNIFLFLLFVGIIFNFTKKRLHKFVNLIIFILFIIIVILPTGKYFLWKLEGSYSIPRTFNKEVDGILILGGGMNEFLTYQYDQMNLNDNVDRLTESIYLMRKFPNAKVIFSGGVATLSKPKLTGADVAKIFYKRMGVNIENIIFENKSRNTYENFLFSKKFIDINKNKNWLLVTSASHMKRAMNVAEKLDLNFEAYPVDFNLEKEFETNEWYSASYPSNIKYFHLAAHELAGSIIYYLTGKSSKIF